MTKKEKNEYIFNVNDLGLFSGCYESIWLSSDMDIDRILEMEKDLQPYSIEEKLDFSKYLQEIAKIYINYFENEFGGVFEVHEILSPKEYNFATDNIWLKWTSEKTAEEMEEEIKAYYKEYDENELFEIEMCSIYDGFYGYELYDNMIVYYIEDKEGNESEVYYDNELQKYTF